MTDVLSQHLIVDNLIGPNTPQQARIVLDRPIIYGGHMKDYRVVSNSMGFNSAEKLSVNSSEIGGSCGRW
jgi:hypothetical protein